MTPSSPRALTGASSVVNSFTFWSAISLGPVGVGTECGRGRPDRRGRVALPAGTKRGRGAGCAGEEPLPNPDRPTESVRRRSGAGRPSGWPVSPCQKLHPRMGFLRRGVVGCGGFRHTPPAPGGPLAPLGRPPAGGPVRPPEPRFPRPRSEPVGIICVRKPIPCTTFYTVLLHGWDAAPHGHRRTPAAGARRRSTPARTDRPAPQVRGSPSAAAPRRPDASVRTPPFGPASPSTAIPAGVALLRTHCSRVQRVPERFGTAFGARSGSCTAGPLSDRSPRWAPRPVRPRPL